MVPEYCQGQSMPVQATLCGSLGFTTRVFSRAASCGETGWKVIGGPPAAMEAAEAAFALAWPNSGEFGSSYRWLYGTLSTQTAVSFEEWNPVKVVFDSLTFSSRKVLRWSLNW